MPSIAAEKTVKAISLSLIPGIGASCVAQRASQKAESGSGLEEICGQVSHKTTSIAATPTKHKTAANA